MKVNVKRYGFDPWVGRSPGEGNGNPLQYACLENAMARGAWWVTVHRAAELDMDFFLILYNIPSFFPSTFERVFIEYCERAL